LVGLLAHARNSDVAGVQRLLGCPVEFARAAQSWMLPLSAMELPIWSEESHLLQILRAHAVARGLPSAIPQITSRPPTSRHHCVALAGQMRVDGGHLHVAAPDQPLDRG